MLSVEADHGGPTVMAIDLANDLQAFLTFATEELAHAGTHLTLDDALDLWHYRNTPDTPRRQALDAIQRGLDDMDHGRTRPVEEFDREFRDRHGISPRP
jgi:hypothetical protein